MASFWLGLRATRWELAVGIPLATVLCLVATTPYDENAAVTSGIFTAVISVGAPVLVGRLLRSRAALNRALREKATQLERRREDAASRAVVDERARIAGELHDVVAHALSAMTVQATGARRLTLNRPELARAAFARDRDDRPRGARRAAPAARRPAQRGGGRDARAAAVAAPPALAHAPHDGRRPAGRGARRRRARATSPAGLDVTAYRVIQEALSAAREQGGAGRADVRVAYRAGDARARDPRRRRLRRRTPADRHPRTRPPPRRPLHGGPAPQRRPPVRATLAYDGRPVTARDETDPDCAGERLLTRLRKPKGDSPLNVAFIFGHALEPIRRARARTRVPKGDSPLKVWFRLRRTPRNVDALVAGLFGVAAVVEVLLSADRDGPVVANVAVALAVRVRAGVAAAVAARRAGDGAGRGVADGLRADADPEPVRAVRDRARVRVRDRRAPRRAGRVRRARADGRRAARRAGRDGPAGRRGLLLRRADRRGDVVRRADGALSHPPHRRAARGHRAAGRGGRGRAAPGGRRRAPPDRARDARRRRALDQRDGRPGGRRAPHPHP